jgi:saccharopine dehydrogenase (NAD+, L-lysine-forming)
MSKVTVLGGCGAVGSVAVKSLAAQDLFSRIRIADLNMARAREVIDETGSGKVSAVRVNVEDPASVMKAIKGSDIVSKTVPGLPAGRCRSVIATSLVQNLTK